MFEIFEHTADLGLRVRAEDRESLFAEAGRGLLSVIAAEPEQVRPSREVTIQIQGTELDYLLFDWLNELLFKFETERLLLVEFDVRITAEGLVATARGEPFDPERHELEHEVKAITYHQLKVEQTPQGWLAEVILDI